MVVALPILIVTIGLQVSCAPTDITADEARILAIHATAVGARHPDELDATLEPPNTVGPPEAWTFRAFTTHVENHPYSNLAGWFSVNKRTAALTDPVLDDEPISIPQIAEEQAALRRTHCLN